ncbi:MAG TPA: tetratricopeptide repeat protein [Flavobacteriales bacterium]|nr:tetratricopeptide repeat protein [Flavobacteriales bacterium]
MIIALNRSDDDLIANMHMIEECEAFEEAYELGDCAGSLVHALNSNRQGRIWLFGAGSADSEWEKTATKYSLGDGMHVNIDSIIHTLEAVQEQSELWKIGRTYDNIYKAHRCLAQDAENTNNPELAFHHYHLADSTLNIIQDLKGYWREERAWSLSNVARTAADLGEYDLSDSLYIASLKRYKQAKDSLDADASMILADWAASYSRRQYWGYANYLLRTAVGLSEPTQKDTSTDARWIKHRLQLVKNLISTDSLKLAERILLPCQEVTIPDSTLHCEALLVKGALQYRQNAFHAADSTFGEAVACMNSLNGNEAAKAMAYLAWGHVKTALAEYEKAMNMVKKGQAAATATKNGASVSNGLLQLSALIHHLKGEYLDAKRQYEECLRSYTATANDWGRKPLVMAGLADLMLDLADPVLGKELADSALVLVVDSLINLTPSQTTVLNTAAYADYYLNDLLKAQQRYTLTLNVCRKYDATATTVYAQALNGQALVAMALSRSATADTLFGQAYAVCLSIYGTEHPFTARVMINQALLRLKQKRMIQARTLLTSALPITERFLGKNHDQLGDIHQALGVIEQRSGQRGLADDHYREALRIYKACFPADHPKVVALIKIGGR